jgi:hypothetical protein
MQRENSFISHLGEAGFAFVVAQFVFVAAQAGGDVSIGIVKGRIRITSGSRTF